MNHQGQTWTTLPEANTRYDVVMKLEEQHLYGIRIEPRFAIGQRALLIQTPHGNILWDCIPLINGKIINQIQALGGIRCIAISHPHYYTGLSEWSHAFGNVPIYLHESDKEWVTCSEKNIVHWAGERLTLFEGITMIRCGGHFLGGCVLHWPEGAEGRGVLMTGDIIQVVPDRRFVSFKHVYHMQNLLQKNNIWHLVSSEKNSFL